jgi:hypothetical protein
MTAALDEGAEEAQGAYSYLANTLPIAKPSSGMSTRLSL